MPSSPASRSPLPAASKSDNDLKRYLETTNSSSTQDSYPTQDPHSFIPQLLPSDSHSSFPDVAAVRETHHPGSSMYSASYTLAPTATVNAGASSSIFDHTAGHAAPTQHSPHINIQATAATPRTVQSNWPVSQGIETTTRTPPMAGSAIRNSSLYTDHTTTASSHTYGVPHNSPTNLTYPIDLNPISSSHYSAQAMYGQGLNQTSPMYPQSSQYKTTVTGDGRHSSIPFPSGDHLPFHSVDHYGYNSPPRQSTLAHQNGKGSPMHISRAVEDDSVGTYGGPPSSSMSQEPSTPASAFSVGSISPLGTLATFAEANPSDSSFSADLSNSKDSPMLTDPPTMYMDGYALGAAYMHDVDGYVGNFGFIPSPAPALPYHLAYDYLQDADNDRGVSTSGQNDVPNSVPTSALLLHPNTYVEPTEDQSHTQSTARGRGRGRARSTAVTGRGKMTQAGRGSPRGHLTLDTASINANDRGPDVGSPGSRKRSVDGMDDDELSNLPHDGSKGGSNTEGSDDREAKRARTQSDSMVTSSPLASSTRRHRATSLSPGSALAVKKGKFRRSVFDNGPQNGIPHTTANESTSMPHSPSPLSQVLPTNPSTENMWPPQSDSTADLYGHTTGNTTDTSARSANHSSAVEPESGEGSNEGSAFEDEEDGSEYEDEDDDDDEYVQGRSSGRRKSTTVRRAGKSGGKNVSAAWALEKVQGGSGSPIIDTSTCGVSDEANQATNMYNRNGKTRRKRISNIPLPIPVPNLTKKSRGRKVPSFPADLASSYGYDASAESSPSGYASREGISKRGTRGRRAPTVVGGPSLEERPFVCEVSECNKRFVRGEHLKRHVRSIHTLDKPFICPQKGCGKTFSRRDNLGQHARVHVTGSG